MFPIPIESRITLFIDAGTNTIKQVATNIDPEVKIKFVYTQEAFDAEAKGEPFVYTI
jgi:hypothetical protein